MYPVVALFSLLFSLSAAHAADIKIETIEEQKISNFAEVPIDIELIVIDDSKIKHKFLLHSEIMKNSRYFLINFKLAKKDPEVVETHYFHTPSIAVFKNILNIMYGAEIQFESFDIFMASILLQEQLEIREFDGIVLEIVGETLSMMPPQALIKILKFTHISPRASSVNCTDKILAYIATNHDKNTNCSRDILVKIIGNCQILIDDIDDAIAGKKKEIIKPKRMPSYPIYGPEIYKKALKIYNKHKEVGSVISVSSSEVDTEKVMAILKKKYNISCNFSDRKKGLNNKYRLKIVS